MISGELAKKKNKGETVVNYNGQMGFALSRAGSYYIPVLLQDMNTSLVREKIYFSRHSLRVLSFPSQTTYILNLFCNHP